MSSLEKQGEVKIFVVCMEKEKMNKDKRSEEDVGGGGQNSPYKTFFMNSPLA
jgi:hypothetical protein